MITIIATFHIHHGAIIFVAQKVLPSGCYGSWAIPSTLGEYTCCAFGHTGLGILFFNKLIDNL